MSESKRRDGLAQLELATDELTDFLPPRAEKREKVVRIVEYSHYPRISRDERRLVAFTRDESRSGLCIVASDPEDEGTLLRVALHSVDGGAALDALAHVVWCQRRPDGRFAMGLALLERSGRRMLKVRRPERSQTGDADADEHEHRAGLARIAGRGM